MLKMRHHTSFKTVFVIGLLSCIAVQDVQAETCEEIINKTPKCALKGEDKNALENILVQTTPSTNPNDITDQPCQAITTLKKCMDTYYASTKSCLKEKAKHMEILNDLMEKKKNFTCHENGANIKQFIQAKGPECLGMKLPDLVKCFPSEKDKNNTIKYVTGSFLKLFDENTSPNEKQCSDISTKQTCLVQVLKGCEKQESANLLEGLMNDLKKVLPCSSTTGTGNSAISILFMIVCMPISLRLV